MGKPFVEKIFTNINEKPFSVLYRYDASRPNIPVNIYAEFTFSEDGKKVLKCAGGQTPLINKLNTQSEQCRIKPDKNKCNQRYIRINGNKVAELNFQKLFDFTSGYAYVP